MAPLTNYVFDKYLAPGVSELTLAEIPDLSPCDSQSHHWISSFFLNSVLRSSWSPPYNAYIFNYLRRVEAAFEAHHDARNRTLNFLTAKDKSIKVYTAALFHWEIFLGQSWHAYALLSKFLQIEKIFSKGENSVEERLNQIYNQMKHVESRIENNQIIRGATVPVWLSNQGLVSIDSALSFAETGEVLMDLAKWANIVHDPLTFQEKVKNRFT